MIVESKAMKCCKCGLNGAFVKCEYPGCHASYHLPCAHSATDVVLQGDLGHLWCPKHTILGKLMNMVSCIKPFRFNRYTFDISTPDIADSDSEEVKCMTKNENPVYDTDEEFAPGAKSRVSKHKSRQEVKVNSKKLNKGVNRSKDDKCAIYRPRTDWQKRGNNLWVKIVPPWWCEQKTVHFASTQDLFQISGTIILKSKDFILLI
jgi:hypothetical protein